MSQSAGRQQHKKQLRSLVQFMISYGCVDDELYKKTAMKILNLNLDSQPRDEDLYKLIHDANRDKLNQYNMMIRTTVDDLTKDKYHILISTVDNEVTKAATRYHPKQVEFFKHMLQSIVHDPRGLIPYSSVRACAEKAMLPTSSRHSSAKRESEALFRDWTAKKWFEVIDENGTDCVTLGVRSMAELDVFIKQKLIEGSNDLDCRNCSSMAIYSVTCSVCESRFHKRCAKTSFDEGSRICRRCSSGQDVSIARDQPTQNNPPTPARRRTTSTQQNPSTPGQQRARRSSASVQNSTPAQSSAARPTSQSTSKRRRTITKKEK